jgi:sugar phosphate isomerase/epimerase
MKTIKGPAIFLAQFAGDTAPFNTLDGIAGWAAGLGYKGVQIPSWDARLFDLKKAAGSKTYCEEVKGTLAKHGLEITELSTHLQGQLVAVHPAYDAGFDGFAAPEVRGDPVKRQQWAVEQLHFAAKASANLGLTAHATFSGALAWPYLYSWPPRPPGLIEEAFDELARRWRPILDAFDAAGVDVGYEIHPGEDLHDGFQSWINRAGRFRSLGDGQVDFKAIFSKMAQYDFPGWAVLEWECCIKHPEDGAREGATFIADHIIRVADRAFDDFAAGGVDVASNRKMLGLG